jgi:hypothetical protein
MPPCVDVYVRLSQADQGVIKEFLARYLDAWRQPEAWLWADAYDVASDAFGPVGSGLTAYAASTARDHSFVMVALPHGGGVVLGVSIDEEPDENASHRAAARYLDEMMSTTQAAEGFAKVEESPPRSDREWREAMDCPGALLTARRYGGTAIGPTNTVVGPTLS